jgi:hypothetical protein
MERKIVHNDLVPAEASITSLVVSFCKFTPCLYIDASRWSLVFDCGHPLIQLYPPLQIRAMVTILLPKSPLYLKEEFEMTMYPSKEFSQVSLLSHEVPKEQEDSSNNYTPAKTRCRQKILNADSHCS